jgi:hypothetical protein
VDSSSKNLNAIIYIVLVALMVPACASGTNATPPAAPTIGNSPTPSVMPSSTLTPTATGTPTLTSTPTITPTPTSTSIAGGAGLVVANCKLVGWRIIAFDLANNEYVIVHDLVQTPELWETDRMIRHSPTRDRVIWDRKSYRNVEIGLQFGEDSILRFSSESSQYYISNADFSGEDIPYNGDLPILWLPNDVMLFYEKDSSESYLTELGYTVHPIKLYIGSLEGDNKLLLAKYKRADWVDGALSPDGRYYAFIAFRDDPDDDWDLGYVAVLDIETQILKDYPFYSFGKISWAPDSSGFTLSGRIIDTEQQRYWGGLFVFDLDERHFSLLREKSFAEWSPDGEWLAGYDSSEAKTVFLMRGDGTDFRLVDLPRESVRWGVDEIQWLPDGSGFFIVSVARYGPEVRHLLFYDIGVEESSVLYEFPDGGFIADQRMYLSPDGRWLILRSFAQDLRFTHIQAIRTFWHVCNFQGCTPFSPPSASECSNLEWVGSNSEEFMSNPFAQ